MQKNLRFVPLSVVGNYGHVCLETASPRQYSAIAVRTSLYALAQPSYAWRVNTQPQALK
jgi:hypothetical protein